MSSNPFDFHDDDDDRKKGKRRQRDEDDDEDDRPRSRKRRREDDDDEEDDRRRSAARRRARDDDDDEDDEDDYDDRPRGPRRGQCPKCGNPRSTKVSYTWWGGILGPAMFSMVQCTRCRTQYNKNTGKVVGAAVIIIYSLVIALIGGGIILAIRLAAK